MAQRNRETGLTPQQEAFAKALALGKSQADAYREAYPRSVHWKENVLHSKASVLASHGKVVERLKSLTQHVEKEFKYTLSDALREADEAVQMAREKREPKSLTGAVTLKAKLAGLMINKVEVTNNALDGLSHEDAKQLLAAIERLEAIDAAAATGGAASPVPTAPSSSLTH